MNRASRLAAEEPRIHRWLRLGVLASLAGGVAAFFALGGPHYLSLDAIREHRAGLLAYTEAHYAQAALIGFAAFVVATLLCLPAGTVFSLVFGLLFGRWVATALLVMAGTLGATLLFLAARYLFARPLRTCLGSLGDRVNKGFTRDAFHWLLFLRLTPIFPYFLVNLAPALTDIPVRTYVAATLVGIFPGMFILANVGQTFGRIDSAQQLFAPEALFALALLGLFALVPVFMRQWRSRRA
ncbi:MAG TPA: TVP38/TMEM64 family protein [Casimicrobiaceae bacterium]|nr:TVP38/TMEM64 family protein [Casimicrobiaceae bacterium]